VKTETVVVQALVPEMVDLEVAREVGIPVAAPPVAAVPKAPQGVVVAVEVAAAVVVVVAVVVAGDLNPPRPRFVVATRRS
jgi:hypothetical protein